MTKLAKLLLVLTSTAPILLTLAFVEFITQKDWSIILPLILVVVAFALFCFYILGQAPKKLESFPITSVSLKPADNEIVGFVLAYLVPILNTGYNEINFFLMAFIYLLFVVIAWNSNAYHFNPILGVLGFNAYEVTTKDNITYVLLTTKTLRKNSDISNVCQLTQYMLLDIQ
ncbi:hypothetical protein G8764_16690 [Pseudomaricurvus alcaniphilus]|uniref:hypothetical protein n=1 Tax=Pseudomaricurvus alcaniphilus TaxID=1166482 RepID=UPI00140D81B2|nr:hypothetical protein [Pseudomaricurvus alcaniphilus]NHN38948.1 hypothetical protein [Pseudomaricurvus alcaniphilus]